MRVSILMLTLAAIAAAQPTPERAPLVDASKTIQVTDHIWVIPDQRINLVPNIGIIVGSRATLVIDAGMGPRNGREVLAEMRKVSDNATVYMTTTHFHPEHVTGFQAFPENAILIRPKVQQEELEAGIHGMIVNFSKMSAANAELLKDVRVRPPDVVFERSADIDLGGVSARLFTLGPAHTKGDNFILVKDGSQSVLFTGDVVTNRFFPIINGSGKNWISILDRLAALHPGKVVPGHGEMDDVGVITRERALLSDLETRILELKREGKSADEAGRMITDEFKAKYPHWENPRFLGNGVKRFYSEAE
jgi:glyoxylase-like metal-dependent hydrolase (beta-lactamase superfamily II)